MSAETVFVSDCGVWKLGSFESARQFDQLSVEFLNTCQSFASVSKQVRSNVCLSGAYTVVSVVVTEETSAGGTQMACIAIELCHLPSTVLN